MLETIFCIYMDAVLIYVAIGLVLAGFGISISFEKSDAFRKLPFGQQVERGLRFVVIWPLVLVPVRFFMEIVSGKNLDRLRLAAIIVLMPATVGWFYSLLSLL